RRANGADVAPETLYGVGDRRRAATEKRQWMRARRGPTATRQTRPRLRDRRGILASARQPTAMFCPKCGQEYRWDVMVCPTCDVDTVDTLPGPEPTPDVDLVCVFTTGDPALIAFTKSLLEGDDIEYFVRGEDLQNMFGLAAGGPAEFWVREDD